MSTSAVADKANQFWDRLAGAEFRPSEIARIDTDRSFAYYKIHWVMRPENEFRIPAYFDTGTSMLAQPRFAAYRYRFVLLPKTHLIETRWQLDSQDVVWMLSWSKTMGHVVTLSTYLSGAGYPGSMHAQSFPLFVKERKVSSLPDAESECIVKKGAMPGFQSLEVSELIDYPLRGVRLVGDPADIASKVFELALIYHHLTAFNLVILPPTQFTDECQVYFFPRRKDGRATYGSSRWQIGAIEANGLMQARTMLEYNELSADRVAEVLGHVSVDEAEFTDFKNLLAAF